MVCPFDLKVPVVKHNVRLIRECRKKCCQCEYSVDSRIIVLPAFWECFLPADIFHHKYIFLLQV